MVTGIESGEWGRNIWPFAIQNVKGCTRILEMTSLTFSINNRWTQYTVGYESAHHFSQVSCYSLLRIRQQEKDIKEKTK